jgi:hypothetical protein
MNGFSIGTIFRDNSDTLVIASDSSPQEHQEGRHRRAPGTSSGTAMSLGSSYMVISSSVFPAKPSHLSATPSGSPSNSIARPFRSPSPMLFPAPNSSTSSKRMASSPTRRWKTATATKWHTWSYPGLPVDYVMEMVHKFYDETYFRPKKVFRIVRKAVVNRDTQRLYSEARSFMELRAQRNKASRKPQSQTLTHPSA